MSVIFGFSDRLSITLECIFGLNADVLLLITTDIFSTDFMAVTLNLSDMHRTLVQKYILTFNIQNNRYKGIFLQKQLHLSNLTGSPLYPKA